MSLYIIYSCDGEGHVHGRIGKGENWRIHQL